MSINYIVVSPAKQNHSGTIAKILGKYNDAVILIKSECKEFLSELLQLNNAKFSFVRYEDSLDLYGKTLKFIIMTQMCWSNTMIT